MGINDPAGHFKGKLIQVTVVVALNANRPRIEVHDPGQIEVVEKYKQPDEHRTRGSFYFNSSNSMTTDVLA